MSNTLKLKIGFLVCLVLFSIVTLVPSFFPNKAPAWWKTYLAPQGLKLGLDLQGGLHLVLRADLDKAVRDSLSLNASDVKSRLAAAGISAVQLRSDNPYKVVYTLPNTGAIDKVREIIKDDFENMAISVAAEEGSFPRITLELTGDSVAFIRQHAVEQSLEIIRNRIDQFGVAEPVIIRQGENEIVVQLPGLDDPKRAIELIKTTAQLQFKLVYEEAMPELPQLIDKLKQDGAWKEEGGDLERLNLLLRDRLPEGAQVYFEKIVNPELKKEYTVPILLHSAVLMTGDMIKNAQVQIGSNFNEPLVSIEMTGRGATIFGDITKNNVGRRLAIILDNVVSSAPRINEAILGGRAQIEGNFTHKEAADLAIALRVGALPANVEIIQNISVGANLGEDSIHKGFLSGIYGTLLVVVFMVIYYRLSGVVANLALLLNILLLLMGMAMLSSTLTLPGIAGIILTVGMAVDANVLIYERMREEFELGKSLRSGIDSGFDKAFWSIVDSQVTTLITALALFLFGTGPIKGFAVTLSLGILFNLFTALFCSRLIFELILIRKKTKTLSFMKFLPNPNYNFIGVKNVAFAASAAMVLLGLFAFVQILRGQANLGVDFTGGAMFHYQADKPFTLEQVRTAFGKNGWNDLNPQPVKGENQFIVKLKKSAETVGDLESKLTAVLQKELPDNHFTVASQSEIGSSVSSALRDKAILAIALSLLGIILYLAVRFDLRFGLAATAATFHDVLAVLGFCYLFGLEINLLIVTALLTLAGYSINDTVVLFDRIRENSHKHPTTPLPTVINDSVNQVLARTLVLSLTVFFVLCSMTAFGGNAIYDFSLSLLVGVIVGSYSSIFIASPMLLWMPAKEH